MNAMILDELIAQLKRLKDGKVVMNDELVEITIDETLMQLTIVLNQPSDEFQQKLAKRVHDLAIAEYNAHSAEYVELSGINDIQMEEVFEGVIVNFSENKIEANFCLGATDKKEDRLEVNINEGIDLSSCMADVKELIFHKITEKYFK